MNLNKLLAFAFTGVFVVAGIGRIKAQPATTNTKPNVVFIIVDDLNDYEGAFGGHPQVKTPNIDKLAKSGTSFTNAHSNCPVCAPSRNSLFTGVYPFASGDFGWTALKDIPELQNNKTIMECFSGNGYHVMGSGKLLHHHRKEFWQEWGININNYGPLAFNGIEPVGHPSVPEPYRNIGPIDGSFAPLSDVPTFPDSISHGNKTGWIYSRGKKDFLEYKSEDVRDLMPDEMHAEWAVKRIKEMDEEGSETPFFMGIGFVRPHTPLYAPKKFFDMFPIDELELSEIKSGDNRDTHYKDIYPAEMKGLRYYRTLKESYNGNAEEGLKHFLQAYLACIAFTDAQIGKVVDAIDNSRFKENTIIVLVADHGWQMGEKEYLFKNSPWEESTRIPMIIRKPGSEVGSAVDHPVSLIDIYPTLIDACDLEDGNKKNSEGIDLSGFSLVPFLKNPELQTWEGPNGALSMVGNGLNRTNKMKQTYSYRAQDWRYILYLDGSEELYHNATDPYEWTNLSDDKNYQDRKKELKAEMLEIVDTINK